MVRVQLKTDAQCKYMYWAMLVKSMRDRDARRGVRGGVGG